MTDFMFIIHDEAQAREIGCRSGNFPLKYPCLWVADGEDSAPYNVYRYEEEIPVLKQFIELFDGTH